MKYLFWVFFISTFAFGQNAEPVIVANQQQFINKKLAFYTLEDANGNAIFTKNDGRNGDITMLFASEYDAQNRAIRNWSAHSNIGYSYGETVYDGNQILEYDFIGDTTKTFAFDRKTLQKINSKQDFLKIEAIQNLESGRKIHTNTKILDYNKNVLREIYLSENGDTTSVNISRYNAQNKITFFHLGDCQSESWVWDIHCDYDEHGDEIQTYRIQYENGVRDTTELRTKTYNAKHQLVSEIEYWHKEFSTRTNYFYNQNDRLISELFYQSDATKRVAETTYKYDKSGKLLKKIVVDYHNSEKGVKQIFTVKDSP